MRISFKKTVSFITAVTLAGSSQFGLFNNELKTAQSDTVSADELISTGTFGSKCSVIGHDNSYWLYYTILSTTEKTVAISGCVTSKENTTVCIPETIRHYSGEEYKVTGIADYTFYQQTNIKNVTGMKWVTKIGCNAFGRCCSLEKIEQDSYVERATKINMAEIGSRAFYGCTNLDCCFLNCQNNISRIGEEAFCYTGEISAVLLTNIQQLGVSCFANSKIKKVHIGTQVSEVPAYCFSDCSQLSKVLFIGSANKKMTAIGERAFAACPFSTIELPNSILTIGKDAFCECRQLEKAAIPDSVTTINSGAFKNCSNLCVTSQGFRDCWYSSLFNQEIDIGDEAFYGTALPSVYFKNKASVGINAFAGCDKMRGAVISNKDSQIQSKAFGFTDTLQKRDGFLLTGSKKARTYAQDNGFNYASDIDPVDFTPYVWGTANKKESHGVRSDNNSEYYYYLNDDHVSDLSKYLSQPKAFNSEPYEGVCTGLAALSVLQYMGQYNVFDNVPAMLKDGLPVTALSQVSATNITYSLRSLVTYYWAAANSIYAKYNTIWNNKTPNKGNYIKELFEYCRLINTGIYPPMVFCNTVDGAGSHAMVAVGAQWKREAYTPENQKYWSHTVDGVTTQFDARIILYDDGFTEISDYNCLYINTYTGDFCREQRYYKSGDKSNTSLEVIPYYLIQSITEPTPVH
ncbi:MAG: leucine-rich repeat domain-containing protein [Oscillospiraceae bacterium]|nr:leucine-rich repeat domain-containing protein [Oscillospiraceae bacterium]